MREIKKLIVHCSDSTFGDRDQINQWHIARGWRGIGYHYVILNGQIIPKMDYDPRRDGEIQRGRMDEEIGAHVEGHNADSLGVCLIGVNAFTPDQLGQLGWLLKSLMDKYKLCPADVYGHYEMDTAHGKTCPNMDMDCVRAGLLPKEHPISETYAG